MSIKVIMKHARYMSLCPRRHLYKNLGKPKNFKWAEKWAQWLIPGTIHNVMAFMICAMGMWILAQ
jgi:hypothetical protein